MAAATDLTANITVYKENTGMSEVASDPFQFKTIIVEMPASANGTNLDTYTLTLADYGITTLKSIRCFRHTTAFSVVVTDEAGVTPPATSVAVGVLTMTLGNEAGAGKRFHIIGGV